MFPVGVRGFSYGPLGQTAFDIRRSAPILYKYTVSGAHMNFEYRQCYQPQPSLRLPSWMRRLWVWL